MRPIPCEGSTQFTQLQKYKTTNIQTQKKENNASTSRRGLDFSNAAQLNSQQFTAQLGC